MVYRTLGYTVVGILSIMLVLGVRYFSEHKADVLLYRASDAQLDLAVVDGIKKNARHEEKNSVPAVRAVIVPHHLVSNEAIAHGVQLVTAHNPQTIIIISPDHYNQCPTTVCTTLGAFTSFFGVTTIAESHVRVLLKESDIVTASSLFAREHGVYTIIPFIKHFAPSAEVIPLVLSVHATMSVAEQNNVEKLLVSLLRDPAAVLIVSSDFSHYLPLSAANAMDAKTEQAICHATEETLRALQNPAESDCPECLAVLYRVATRLNFWNPHIVAHTNSATLLHNSSVQETTSHFVVTLSEQKYEPCELY